MTCFNFTLKGNTFHEKILDFSSCFSQFLTYFDIVPFTVIDAWHLEGFPILFDW